MPKLFLHFGGKIPKQIVFLASPACPSGMALEPGFHYGFVITVRFSSPKRIKPSALYHSPLGPRMPALAPSMAFPRSFSRFFVLHLFLQ